MASVENQPFIFAEELQKNSVRIISSVCGSLPPPLSSEDLSASHSHRAREILFVVAGESDYQLDDKFYHLQAGDAVFIEPWQKHGFFYRASDHDLKHIWFALLPQRMTATGLELDHFGQIGRKHFYGNLPGDSWQMLAGCWDRLRLLPEELLALGKKQLQLGMEMILNEISITMLSESSDWHINKHQDVMEFTSDYIDLHHGRNCSLVQLEKITGYTQYYLCRLFRKYYGKTIGDAINEARMRYVLEQKAVLSSKDIADELGFAAVVSFWKWRRSNRKLEEQLQAQLQYSKKSVLKH